MSYVTHILQIFLTLLVPVVCLGIVYFLGRIKPIGRFYAVLLIPAGKLFFALSDFLSPFDVKRRISESKYPGLRTIVLLIALCFVIVALVSDGYNTLQALPALWNDASISLPPLPAVFTYSMGWLFLSLPALTGAIWLEQKKAVEKEVQIFTVPQEFQKKFERFVLLTFVLSLLASIAFNALKPSFTADNTSLVTQVLQICVFVLLGALLPLIMALTVYILALALQAVGSFLLTIVCFVSSLLADLIDFLVMDFSRYEKSIKDTQKGVRVIDRSSTVTIIPEQKAPFLLPQNTSTTVDDELEEIVPIETTISEVPMTNPENVAIVLVGGFGTKMLPHISQKIKELRPKGIRSLFYLDLSVTQILTSIDGVVDLSPTNAQRQAILLHEETEDQAYRKLLNKFPEKLVETHIDAKAYPDTLIFVIDCRQLVDSVEMLESISRRLPLHSLVVVTEVSSQNVQSISVQTGIGDMQSLHAEDFLETTIVTDPRSPFATQYGLDTQHKFLAHTLVGLVVAHKHSLQNRSFVNVLRDLHSHSPFTAISFASEGSGYWFHAQTLVMASDACRFCWHWQLR